MEYSCYYYHSNILTKIFTFIKDDNLVKIFISYIGDEYCNEEDYVDFDFTIAFEELKSCKKLYEYYKLSILLTKNIHEPSYCEERDKNCILFRKNWKGMYFTDYYSNTVIHNIDNYQNKGVISIDEEKKNKYKDYVDIRDKDEYDYLSKYLKSINS